MSERSYEYRQVKADAVGSGERTELELMRLLDANPQLTQRQVASSLGISLGMVNYCLRALVARGLVKVENYRNSDKKSAYFYLVTPSGLSAKAELTREFLARRVQEYNAMRVEIEDLRREQQRYERGAKLQPDLALDTDGASRSSSTSRRKTNVG